MGDRLPGVIACQGALLYHESDYGLQDPARTMCHQGLAAFKYIRRSRILQAVNMDMLKSPLSRSCSGRR
jgi:hypothetical protein